MVVNLRLHTFDPWGNELVTPWSFTPLVDEDSYDIYRESDAAADGTLRRRPYQEREIRVLTLGAGLLLAPAAWINFRRMLRAHAIEWQRSIGGRMQWIAYALDAQEKVEFERLSGITVLRRIKITLMQSAALPFTQFELSSKQLSDELGPATLN